MTEATSIAVLSNIIFEPHFLPLIKRRFGSNVIVSPIPYGEHNGLTYQSAAANADGLLTIYAWHHVVQGYVYLHIQPLQE